jgi:hypothetical protein
MHGFLLPSQCEFNRPRCGASFHHTLVFFPARPSSKRDRRGTQKLTDLDNRVPIQIVRSDKWVSGDSVGYRGL